MYPKVTYPRSVNQAIDYSEKKVKKGVAECIHAGNFLQDACELSVKEKKEFFSDQIASRPGSRGHTLHTSLNFAEGEELTRERLI